MTDKQKEYEARVNEFNSYLDELDAKSEQWDAKRRAEYEAERDNFKGRLKAWGDNVGAHWGEFVAESSQLWNKIKAKWYSEN